MCVYVDSNHKGIPDDIKDEAEKWFFGYNIEYKDLQRPCRRIVTELPSSRKTQKEKLSDLSRKIRKNLHVFEKRVNVTAVGASYKITDLKEKDIPCVTVFVLDKGRIPAGETDISKINENYGELFGNTEFDVVEGYFKSTNLDEPRDASYTLPLRGGVGIGVRGSDGAGTLGGFLEDEDGKCYIFSNEHVLNPLKRKDGTNEVMHVAGTSEQLSPDAKGVGNNRLNQQGEDVDMENSTDTEIIIEQPAQSDYDDMVAKSTADIDFFEKEKERIEKKKMEATQQGKCCTKLDVLMKKNKKAMAKAKARREEIIEEGKTREVGRYVCGLRKNVKLEDQNCWVFVDAAIAELNEDELQYMKTFKSCEDPKNRCPLYGFVNEGAFWPNGGIVDLEKFSEILRTEEREFSKFGRTTGFTNEAFVPESDSQLFVRLKSDLQLPDSDSQLPGCDSQTPGPSCFPFFHTRHLYCKECSKSFSDEETTSKERSKKVLEEFSCTKCGKPLSPGDKNDIKDDVKDNVEDDVKDDIKDDVKDNVKDNVEDDVKDDAKDNIKNNVKGDVNDDVKDDIKDDVKDDIKDDIKDDVKDDVKHNVKAGVKADVEENVKYDVKDGVLSYWAENCFVIRKNEESFNKPGDSGAIVFGSKGLAWGLVFGSFKHPLKNTDYCLASPLCVALKALEQKSRIKGLKLW